MLPLRPEDPERIGAFEIIGLLGQGPRGEVFLGREADDAPTVAIKLLPALTQPDPDVSARSAPVASAGSGQAPSAEPGSGSEVPAGLPAAQRVSSSYVARVLDTGSLDGRPYIVREYVEGRSLARAIADDGPLSGDALERIAIGVLTALSAVHLAGLSHRSLTPHNVILGPDGPRVTDAAVGEPVGEVAYQAPEQLKGIPYGPHADVFAWAATIVFAATGEPPFDGREAVLDAEPEVGVGVGVEAELMRRVLLAAMAKEAGSRPTAYSALMQILGHPADPTPPTQNPTPSTQRTTPPPTTSTPDAQPATPAPVSATTTAAPASSDPSADPAPEGSTSAPAGSAADPVPVGSASASAGSAPDPASAGSAAEPGSVGDVPASAVVASTPNPDSADSAPEPDSADAAQGAVRGSRGDSGPGPVPGSVAEGSKQGPVNGAGPVSGPAPGSGSDSDSGSGSDSGPVSAESERGPGSGPVSAESERGPGSGQGFVAGPGSGAVAGPRAGAGAGAGPVPGGPVAGSAAGSGPLAGPVQGGTSGEPVVGVPMSGPGPFGVPPQGPMQVPPPHGPGPMQVLPPQGPGQGPMQVLPPQGPMQAPPGPMQVPPPQGPGQGPMQVLPPRGPGQVLPPQGPPHGPMQVLPPQGPSQGVPSQGPPPGAVQGPLSGVPVAGVPQRAEAPMWGPPEDGPPPPYAVRGEAVSPRPSSQVPRRGFPMMVVAGVGVVALVAAVGLWGANRYVELNQVNSASVAQPGTTPVPMPTPTGPQGADQAGDPRTQPEADVPWATNDQSVGPMQLPSEWTSASPTVPELTTVPTVPVVPTQPVVVPTSRPTATGKRTASPRKTPTPSRKPQATRTSARPTPTRTSAKPTPTRTSARPTPTRTSARPTPTRTTAAPTPTKSSAKPTVAAQAQNPYTPTAACGSGFVVQRSSSFAGGVTYQLWNDSTGENCAVTMKTADIGVRTSVSVKLEVQGGGTLTDSGSFDYYAGPVTLPARGKCVRVSGSTGSGSTSTSWGNCG
ncbi:Serine/threonine protein kinase [Nonomuraea maritima]|uniref:Serine/threonine protein kinase n=1 Tax=Nonomuraea maritima TaxID=683260 RepID=A0A1G9A936_9ACTN|nr:serine/threonine-protein kinase [Nonomuraea maritima]SDK23859.1 Serine/threonine protein kinase [Nonomuraea maritima]